MIFTNAKRHDWTAAEYFAHPAVSRSELVQALTNPAKFQHWKANPPSSTSMATGSMVHALVLEPEALADEFHVVDLDSRRGNAWKDAVAEAGDRTPVLRKDMAETYAIVDACKAEFGSMVDGSQHEVSITATHARTGMDVKCRVDMLGDCWLSDLKTTRDASENGFARSVHAYRYDIQDAMYSDIVAALLGLEVVPFFFACVETSAPFMTGLWDLNEAWRESGRDGYEQAIDDYMYHTANGWPCSYGRGTLTAKPWMIGA